MELALLLPVVALLLLAVLQVALVGRDLVLVTHAAREAVREAAVDPSPSAVRRAALGSGGLRADRLRVRITSPGADGRVTVILTYRLPGAVPILGRAVAGRTVRVTATMRDERRSADHPLRESG